MSLELLFDTVQPNPMSFKPICFKASNVRRPLSKPPAWPRNSSFLQLRPSMEIRMPICGYFSASAMTFSSNQPEVEMTMRSVCL